MGLSHKRVLWGVTLLGAMSMGGSILRVGNYLSEEKEQNTDPAVTRYDDLTGQLDVIASVRNNLERLPATVEEELALVTSFREYLNRQEGLIGMSREAHYTPHATTIDDALEHREYIPALFFQNVGLFFGGAVAFSLGFTGLMDRRRRRDVREI